MTPEMSDLCVSLALDGAALDEDDKQPLAVLHENSLQLNEKFREETAAVYFAFLGCYDEFTELCRFNVFADSGYLSRYLDALNVLTDLVIHEVRFPGDEVANLQHVALNASSPVATHASTGSV